MKKRLYIAYTGGTIGMQRTAEGYAPAPGFLAEQLAALPELAHPHMPDYTLHEYTPLLDSSNMTPADWARIAQDIADHYHEYDGFIVLHGTDTMAYSASALAFMLRGLRKPVIFTGSQIPLCEIRSDGRAHLITAMLLAAQAPLAEVALYFGNQLLRGCRATKVDATGFAAFSSPNFPPLGDVGIGITLRHEALWPPPPPDQPLDVAPLKPVRVAALRLFPGIPAEIVANILRPPLRGLILEAYGVGNAPTNDAELMAALEEASARGVIIAVCSQCLRGRVDLGGYATGSALARIGAISGYDMTPEAALTKLIYLLSQDLPTNEVKRLFQTNLRGEMSVERKSENLQIS